MSVALAVAGCGFGAAITMADGTEIEGEILAESEQDADYLHVKSTVRTKLDDSRVERQQTEVQRIDRKRVVDIDHPGNVAVLIGLGLAGLGGWVAYKDLSGSCRGAVLCLQGLPTLFLGVPLGLGGLTTIAAGAGVWTTSVSHAQSTASVTGFPLVLTDGEQTYCGAGAAWRW